jgi:hypothetical protein
MELRTDTLEERLRRIRAELGDVETIYRYGRPGEPSEFAAEVDQVQGAGKQQRARDGTEPPDLLLLTVGTSPEPLLLAVAYHAPRQVALLVEMSFGDEELSEFERFWNLTMPK